MKFLRKISDSVLALPERKFAALLLCAAGAARFAFAAVWISRNMESGFGTDAYYDIAREWLGWGPPVGYMGTGEFISDIIHPPGYSSFIVASLRVFGDSRVPVALLQTLIGALTVLIIWKTARKLVSETAARTAALICAFDPLLIFFTPQMQSETLYLAFQMLFFLLFYAALETENKKPLWFLSGLAGGIAVLVRSVVAAYPAMLFALFAATRRRLLVPLLILAAGWLLPTAFWTARNYAKYNAFIPISPQGSYGLYGGFTADLEETRLRALEIEQYSRQMKFTFAEREKYFRDKTLAFMREHPAQSLKIMAKKTGLYWRPWTLEYPAPVAALITVYYLALFGFALYGLGGELRRERWLPIYSLFAYLTVIHAIYYTALRYRLPIEPFLCMLAAAGLERLAGKS